MMLREISLIFWLISGIQQPLTSVVLASQLPASQSVPNKRFTQSASKNVHMGHVPRSGVDQFRGNKLKSVPVTAVSRASSSASDHNGNMTLESQQLLLENEVSRRCMFLGSALMACEATWAGWKANWLNMFTTPEEPEEPKKKRKRKRKPKSKPKPKPRPPSRLKDIPPAPPPRVPQTTRRPQVPQTTRRPHVPQTTRRAPPQTTRRPQVLQTTRRPPPPQPPLPGLPQYPSIPPVPQQSLTPGPPQYPPQLPAPPPQSNIPIVVQSLNAPQPPKMPAPQYPAPPVPAQWPSIPAGPQPPPPQYPPAPAPTRRPNLPAVPQPSKIPPRGPGTPARPHLADDFSPPHQPLHDDPPDYPDDLNPPRRPANDNPPGNLNININPPDYPDKLNPPRRPANDNPPGNLNININPPDYPDELNPLRRPAHDEPPDSPGGDSPDQYDKFDSPQHSFDDEVPFDQNIPFYTTFNYNDVNSKVTVESKKHWFSFEANIPINLSSKQQRPRNTRCYYNGGKVCIKFDGTICKKPCYKRCKPRTKPCKNYCPSHNTSYNQFNIRKNYKESTNSTNFNPQSPRSRRSVKFDNRQGKSGHRLTTNKNVNLNAFHKTHAKSTTASDQNSGNYWNALSGLFTSSGTDQRKCGNDAQPCEVGDHFTRREDYSDHHSGGNSGGSSYPHGDFQINFERMARYIASRVVDSLPDDLRHSDWAYKFAYDIVLRKLKILESLNSPNSNIVPYPPCCCDDEDENSHQTYDTRNAKTSSVPLTQHLVVHVQSADSRSAPSTSCLPPIEKISAGGYVKANNLAWFKIHHRKEPFDRARSICHDEGAHVANILSLDEVLWLGKHLSDIGVEHAYVGLLASTLRNDSFFTVTDQTVGTYIFQRVLTNTRVNGKRCVMVSRRKTLSYINCGRQLPFICKVPPSDPCCGRYDATVGRRP